ncbi:hypothetical protein [Streptomyces antnestii]|uniref:hypothetical protein n=1 Tax=Streptomyces antnestii TaxID=2494256 RepID=UPI001CB8E2D7|nr:hypothetical protein [Streptomyces sp. San01]
MTVRRSLLTGGIKPAAGAAVLGGGGLLAAVPHRQQWPIRRSSICRAGGNPVRSRTLHKPYGAMQSFAYDSVNGRIYFAQHKRAAKPGISG